MNVREAYQTANRVRNLVRDERESGPMFDFSPRERLRFYRRRFLSKSGFLYDFDTYDPSLYLDDYQRYIRSGRINDHWGALIDNKLAFHEILGEFPSHRSTVHGLLRDGQFHVFEPGTEGAVASDGGVELERPTDPDASRPTVDPVDWLDDSLSDGDRLVLKWFSGGGGNNVHFLEREDGTYLYDGTPTNDAGLARTLADLEDYLVCEFVEQDEYADELYPDTVNTIRVLTMYDERAQEAFVPIAVQRIGTSDSAPVDNFSKGGLSAEVDRETGALSAGAHYYHRDSVTWHETHPETGARIEGTTVPGWEEIRDKLLEIANALSHMPYVGWDIVVTGEGEFKIIEGNSQTGVAAMQVHRPLLADERTRRFYRRHDVV
ncbi:sugar-transfer associated ATP-grasp domain-containing protein [Natronococcus wangiae]|uniref:sugar-transfer associated ATP-grasp domain-containing protein n=1 Tax=Natronococcus wangiae TaxID=3068275 RepID=UPI00273EAB61|nr:sugar-transfer associated ATP-grasp domain-containing protein [Natronococcus sp. AD5]